MASNIDTRHGLLEALAIMVQPQLYLEIGVHHGDGMKTVLPHAEHLIGVDPVLTVGASEVNAYEKATLVEGTSDAFFAGVEHLKGLDLVFVDGLHLIEQAARDFVNAIRFGHRGTVIAMDDVLPNNAYEATREFHEGNWTGDVWKILYALDAAGDFDIFVADVAPTGLLVYVVTGEETDSELQTILDITEEMARTPVKLSPHFELTDEPTEDVLQRLMAFSASDALALVKMRHEALIAQ